MLDSVATLYSLHLIIMFSLGCQQLIDHRILRQLHNVIHVVESCFMQSNSAKLCKLGAMETDAESISLPSSKPFKTIKIKDSIFEAVSITTGTKVIINWLLSFNTYKKGSLYLGLNTEKKKRSLASHCT